MISRRARLLALLAVVAAFALAGYMVLAPTGMRCEATSIGSAQTIATPGPCRSTTMLEMGLDPRAVAFIAMWTLAPLLALVGIGTGYRPLALLLTAAALVLELTSVVSMGGGFVFAIVVAPLLLLTLLTLLREKPAPWP